VTMPALTPYGDAVAIARDARRRGCGKMLVVVNAEGRQTRGPQSRLYRGTVPAWLDIPGVDGTVIRRHVDDDGIIRRLTVSLDVTDVLAASDVIVLASLEDIPPPPKRVERFSMAR
jgi:hypothetical protein